MTEHDALVYLYGFVSAGADPPAVPGIEGARVELKEIDGLTAAISAVPADAYSEAALAERLGDLRRAAELGAIHERVVSWFVDHGGILPARMLTIHGSIESLRAAVVPRSGELAAEFERFRSLREWDLKVAFDEAVLGSRLHEVSDDIAALERQAATAAPGRRYLINRKRASLVRTEAAAAAARLAEELLESLAAHAREVKRLPLQGGGSTLASQQRPGALPVTLNAALLVPADAERELVEAARERAGRLKEIGLEVSFSGPWAPYRFVSTGEREPDAAGA